MMHEEDKPDVKILDANNLEFIKKRIILVRWWSIAGSVMLAVLGGLMLWLFVRVPNFINPLHVAGQLQAGTLEQTSLEIMAVILPIVVLGLLLVCVVMISFGFVVFANERRYIQIIEEIQGGGDGNQNTG